MLLLEEAEAEAQGGEERRPSKWNQQLQQHRVPWPGFRDSFHRPALLYGQLRDQRKHLDFRFSSLLTHVQETCLLLAWALYLESFHPRLLPPGGTEGPSGT